MSRPLLLLTRPAEEAGRTAEAAQRAGFDTLPAPLLEIEGLPFELPPFQADALLFTSARAPRLVAAAEPALIGLPAYAVGARTAEELVAAGFRLAGEGALDGSAILARAAADGALRLLHLAGAATAPLAVPEEVELLRVPVYAARRVAHLSGAALDALSAGQVFATLLFSARTARHFRSLIEGAGLAPAGQRVVALSAAVAEGAGPGWAAVGVAPTPGLDGALAAALRLWQGDRHG